MYRYYNPNPVGSNKVGDCAVRAVAKALGITWEDAFAKLAAAAYRMGDMPNSNAVISAVLRANGFYRENLPDCPNCMTIRDFAFHNPVGTYVVGTGSHVVTIINGDYYDSWDSSDENVMYFWTR
jgi:hypothetical protein